MNKLTHVESQRIMSLMEETIQKIQLISLVTRDIASVPSDVADLLTESILSVVKQHRTLEDQYAEMVSKRVDEVENISLLRN